MNSPPQRPSTNRIDYYAHLHLEIPVRTTAVIRDEGVQDFFTKAHASMILFMARKGGTW
jgi:hypothetical protein